MEAATIQESILSWPHRGSVAEPSEEACPGRSGNALDFVADRHYEVAMTVSSEILTQLSSLGAPLRDVQASIDTALGAHLDSADLSASGAISNVEGAVEGWLNATEEVEDQLLSYVARSLEVEPQRADEDGADAVSRLCGLSLLHAAVAIDLSHLATLDAVEPGALVSDAPGPWPTRSTMVQQTAWSDGNVLESLTSDEGDGGADRGGPASATVEGDLSESDAMGVATVIADLLDRATGVSTNIMIGMVPGVIPTGSAVISALYSALTAAPNAIEEAVRHTVRRIAKLVALVIRRLHKLLLAVTSGYQAVIDEILSSFGADELLTEALIHGMVSKILDTQHVISAARQGLLRVMAVRVEFDAEGKGHIDRVLTQGKRLTTGSVESPSFRTQTSDGSDRPASLERDSHHFARFACPERDRFGR